jgi:hypothetical protein
MNKRYGLTKKMRKLCGEKITILNCPEIRETLPYLRNEMGCRVVAQ